MQELMHENKTFDKPILKHLDLETSSICNLSCNFCPRPKENGTMPENKIYQLLREFADLGGDTVKPFWRGEPFADKRMPMILRAIKGNGLKSMINTNGSDPHGIFKDCLPYIDWISFSIDEQHNNINSSTRNKVVLAADFAKYGARYIEIQASKQNDFVEDFCDGTDWHFESIPYKVDIPTKRSDKDTTSEVITGERKYCSFPEWRLIIDWQGNAHPCCVCWDDDTLIMGNIYTQSLSEIFNGDKMNQLRQDLKDGNYFKYKTCKNCTSRKAYK